MFFREHLWLVKCITFAFHTMREGVGWPGEERCVFMCVEGEAEGCAGVYGELGGVSWDGGGGCSV